MKSKIDNWFGRTGTRIIVRFKFIFLAAFVILFLFGYAGLSRVVMNDSYESMLEKGDPVGINNEVFNERFGNSEYIFILIEAKDIFKKEVLQFIKDVGEDIEQNLPFVKDYMGITNVEYISVDGDELIVEELVGDTIPMEKELLNEIKQKALKKEIYRNRIIDEKGTQAGIFIRFNNIPDSCYVVEKKEGQLKNIYFTQQVLGYKPVDTDINYKLIKEPHIILTPTVEYLLERNSDKYKAILTGTPVSDYYIMTILQNETGKAFAITLLVAIIVLSFLYKSVLAVVSPIITIISSIIITFGLLGWFKIVVSTYALVVILLLLVISVGYSIHIINHFRKSYLRQGSRIKALEHAYAGSGWPCFISALTTIIGFISFIVVDIVPVKNMGIACAIGVFTTFILIVVLVPIFLSFGKDKQVETDDKGFIRIERNSLYLKRIADRVIGGFRTTSIISGLLIILCVVFVFNIRADTNYVNLFGMRLPFVQDAVYSTENIGSLYSYEVSVELPMEEMAKEPSVMNAFEELGQKIESYSTTKMTSSIIDLLKDINQTMNNNDTNFYKLPNTRELIAQYLLMYEMSGGDELENWVDFSYQVLRKSVYVRKSTTDLINSFSEIRQFVKDNFPEGTNVRISGNMATVLRAISALVDGQVLSILFAFIGVAIMMMISLRSFKGGLISMIPNTIPIFFIMGFMGFAGITLNIQSIVVAPLILGIAVDDTVHYFLHFKKEFMKTRSYKIANQNTYVNVGWALVNTSLILVIGFLPYSFSPVVSFKQLSVLIIIGVIIALLADLLITPALFNWLKPFGQEEKISTYNPQKLEQ